MLAIHVLRIVLRIVIDHGRALCFKELPKNVLLLSFLKREQAVV